VNPNYTSVNVEQSLYDGNSILHFYRKLIRLRRENKALIYGDYREIFKDSEELGGYVRTLGSEQWTVLCNFTDRNVAIPTPLAGTVVLSNLNDHDAGIMKPYETVICKAEYEAD
ncbi:DUF3459 domain-containing protein, partial [Paenibacillus zanthoxyli]|uniref:DUF3459 domain-containing protein n=1 Tax=Paenibacillus zanthoxyli TaxID=369399 RepID=UPI0005600EB3